MKPRMTGFAGALAFAALLSGCATDPLGDLDGEPAAIIVDASRVVLDLGDSRALTASIVDGRLTPLEVPVTFEACDTDIELVPDNDYNPVPNTSHRAIVTAEVLDLSCVVASGAGFSKTVDVINLPAEFDGAVSATTI